ncbi:hypothetical protein RRG08_004132 [Elysia crispata]|uniref:Uncharacterized protein n=1 Tax=Elysia crispata TaxID=231223 RepID=A0AAE1D5P9_9GAST|nr:hypothetical protein RRG08_004132 [Elysia crispata]
MPTVLSSPATTPERSSVPSFDFSLFSGRLRGLSPRQSATVAAPGINNSYANYIPGVVREVDGRCPPGQEATINHKSLGIWWELAVTTETSSDQTTGDILWTLSELENGNRCSTLGKNPKLVRIDVYAFWSYIRNN